MTDFKMVPLAEIKPDPNQPRKFFDEISMAELTDSIKEKGVLQPLLLRPIGSSESYLKIDPAAPMSAEVRKKSGYNGPLYLLVCGERRYRASSSAGLQEIPAVIRELTDEEALELQIIENLQRKDVHPMEEAVAFQSLLENGKEIAEIANRVGKSVYYARQRVKLCNLIKEWQEAFFKGRLENINNAITIAAFDHKIQKELLNGESHYSGKISINDYQLRQYRGDLSKAPFGLDDITLDKKAGSCTACKFNTAAANLFPDAEVNPKCTNINCFKHKCDVHFDHALAEAKKDPLIIFVNTDYSDIPNNNTILAGLVKEGHQVLNGRMKCGFHIIELPKHPEFDDYEDEDCSDEENQQAYADAIGDYNKEVADYEKKINLGKFKKAFSIHGDDKGRYVYLEYGKSAGSSKAAGSSTLTKQKEAAGKLTAADVTEEIKRIQDREKRAKEIDVNKSHKAILEALASNKDIKKTSIDFQGKIDRSIMIYLLLHEVSGPYIHQKVRAAIKRIPADSGKVGYAFEYFKALGEINDHELACIIRIIAMEKFGNVNMPNDVHRQDTILRLVAEYAGIDIPAIETEQATAAAKRIGRVEKRIAELQEKKKELSREQKPTKKNAKK
jgi:ParB family chromosome partitioning protein